MPYFLCSSNILRWKSQSKQSRFMAAPNQACSHHTLKATKAWHYTEQAGSTSVSVMSSFTVCSRFHRSSVAR